MNNSVNPYVNKLKEQSEYIIPCYSNKIRDEDVAILQEKISNFSDISVSDIDASNIIVEVCSGSGAHLIELAKKFPLSLIIGFELRFKRIFKTAQKAKRENLNNIILIRNDARNLNLWFKERKISKLFINFPDPWDRDRWIKHRVLSKEFFDNLSKLLKKHGEFLYKTDHTERFLETKLLLEENNLFNIVEYSEDLYNSPYIENNIKTEFESLFLSQELNINYLKAVKK
ncbi:MAG: tRNA (guanosine(46)-N7)-methyltransferase TrmB [Bdellovibrionota bacterium]